MIFLSIGTLWVVFWIRDQVGFITMFSASSYYFSSNERTEGSAEVLKGVVYSWIHHGGSLAFGSCIHTIMYIIIWLVDFVTYQAEQEAGNCIVSAFTCCIRCCVRCIESYVESLNEVSYAQMVISSESYCKSAWHGHLL